MREKAGGRRRMQKGSDEYRRYQAAVARLLADRLKQGEVASRLGVSESTVTRLLRDNEFLERRVDYNSRLAKNSGTEFVEAVDALVGEPGLRDGLSRLNPHGADIRVKVVYPREKRADSLEFFAESAGPRFAKWLERASRVGVCWGGSIARLISAAAHDDLEPAESGKRRIAFIPLCGIISANPEAAYYSSTNLALQLSREVNRDFSEFRDKRPRIYNLNFIPMRFPNGFGRGEPYHEAVRAYVDAAFPDYREIFGTLDDPDPAKGMANRLDTILTGIGGRRQSRQFDHLETALLERNAKGKRQRTTRSSNLRWRNQVLDKKILVSEVIDGDIAGILIPRRQKTAELNRRARDIVDELNTRLTTLRPAHLWRCAALSRDEARNGVIVVAAGAHKAHALLQAVKLGYVSRIIIDSVLAKALKTLLDRYEPAAPDHGG